MRPSSASAVREWQAEQATYGPPTGAGRCPACGGLLRQYGDDWLCPVGLDLERERVIATLELRSIYRDMAFSGELDPTADELEF